MRLDKGQPSGTNKSEGTGTPSKIKNDEELTRKYTNEDKNIAKEVRTNNQNRNTSKEDATNAGGYKN